MKKGSLGLRYTIWASGLPISVFLVVMQDIQGDLMLIPIGIMVLFYVIGLLFVLDRLYLRLSKTSEYRLGKYIDEYVPSESYEELIIYLEKAYPNKL